MFSFNTKVLAVSLFCLAASFTASAQLSMPVEHRVNSPQFNQDGTVTFRLYAPQAKDVQIRGDFLTKDVKRGESARLLPAAHTAGT